MKLLLPLFPVGTKLISDILGVYEKEGIVQYIVNGLPVYSHSNKDRNAFRYITSNFIHQGLCRKIDVQRCFHLSEDSVQRAYNKFTKEGVDAFFGEDGRKGKAYKIMQSIDNSLEYLPAITQKQVVLFEKIEQHQQKEDELKM